MSNATGLSSIAALMCCIGYFLPTGEIIPEWLKIGAVLAGLSMVVVCLTLDILDNKKPVNVNKKA